MNNKKEIKTNSTTRAFFKFLKEIANFRRIEIELVKQILEEAFIKTIQKKFDPEAEIELVVDFENEEFRLVNKKSFSC